MTLGESPSAELVVVFLKHPTPGTVKTRLAVGVGEDRAARIYGELVQTALNAVGGWLATPRPPSPSAPFRTAWLYFDPPAQASAVAAWLAPSIAKWSPPPVWVAQPNGDLGQRLQFIYNKGFNHGFSAIVAIGTDCPELDSEALADAFGHLREKEVVVGPARDGGYYLIGLKKLHNKLFMNIPWSSPLTLRATLEVAERLGLTVSRLDPLDDIDTEDDWQRWRDRRGV